MMIKKVDTSFVRRVQRGKTTVFGGILRFKPLFCQSASTNLAEVSEKVYLGVSQHPIKFQTKILTGKFYL